MASSPHLILIGSQGSGKGTQAERLHDRHGYTVIGTGQLLRAHVREHDELGQRISKPLARGELVSDAIIEQLIRHAVDQITPGTPIVFDGFPRTLAQAHFLDRLFSTLDWSLPNAVYLQVPRATVVERLSSRHICQECGKIVSWLPGFLQPMICPQCGGHVGSRLDDRPEILESRLNLFFEHTLPVISYYEDTHRLIKLEAQGPVDEVTILLEKAVGLPPSPLHPDRVTQEAEQE